MTCPDVKLLATASGGDGTVRLWDPLTGRPVGALFPADTGPSGGLTGVAFSPDGKLLASAEVDGTVRLWDPLTGQSVGAPIQAGAQTNMSVVAFSPDGKLLASAGGDGTVRLWQVSLFAILMRRSARMWDHRRRRNGASTPPASRSRRSAPERRDPASTRANLTDMTSLGPC